MARPVFKTAMEGPPGAPVGSIPTRSRHRGAVGAAAALVLVALFSNPRLAAQSPPPAAPPPIDTLNPLARPVKPLKSFFMSLAVPGWGQARMDRKLTGAIFVSLEGLSLGMTVKTIRELKYLSRVEADSARIDGKRSQRQDWLIFLGFNHLFSGLESFVSSQLHEFPTDLRFRVTAVPGGGFAAQASIPFRIR